MQQVWHRKRKRAGLPPQTQAARGHPSCCLPSADRVATCLLHHLQLLHAHTTACCPRLKSIQVVHRPQKRAKLLDKNLKRETPQNNGHKTELDGKWAWGRSEPVCHLCRHTHLCNGSSVQTRTILKDLAPTTAPFPGLSVDLPHQHVSSGRFQAINTKAPPQGPASTRCLPSASTLAQHLSASCRPEDPALPDGHTPPPLEGMSSINPTTTPHTPLGHFHAHTWYF